MKKKKIRNQMIRNYNTIAENIYRIICINNKTSEIWIADEFSKLEIAKEKIDKYRQDGVSLYIQNKNSNRIVYTR
tara:strand:- start:41 stop:265 length:225 start_codon:yes stop_codon:yes gene_type:complete